MLKFYLMHIEYIECNLAIYIAIRVSLQNKFQYTVHAKA